MGFLAGFSHNRARAALGAGAIVAVSIIVPSAVSPKVTANPGPPTPFDSNGFDNSFAIAQSREQGPVIDGSAPAARMAADAAVPALGDPVKGTFGPQVGWPIMPIHAVLLPDGRVMSYGTEPDGSQTAIYRYDVWDPREGTEPNAHVLLPNTTQTDIFCSSQIVLLNGDVAMFGGDNLPTSSNTHNDHVNLFHPASNTIERAAVPNDHMNRLRWYSSATVLPNAEVYIQGGSGGADLPERRNSNGSFTLLSGAPTNTLSSGYPKNWVAPNGLVFGIANNQMYEVNPAGNGTIRMIATASRTNTGGTSTAVMFEPGKILQVGGGSRDASLIDINTITPQLTPVVTPLPQLQYQRQWGNATVMADGRVFVSGGSAVNNAATGVAYTSEIFNPAGAGSWSTGPTATRMRLYHSTSLLLPDASVITMGGGTPGPETNLNAEIYYPPYLFKADGTPAVRPTITTATAVTDPGMPLSIETPDAVSRVSLVKTGSVTHSDDMDQRFLDLPFTQSGGTVTATLPTNVNRTPPGYYMIFVVNAAGVPSEAKFVKINVAGTTPPPTTTTTSTTSTTTSTTTTTMPPTTTSTTTTMPPTTTSTTSTTSTSTTTTTSPPPPPSPTNLTVNGGFENNPLGSGTSGAVAGLPGWANAGGTIDVFRSFPGFNAAEGTSIIELDSTSAKDRIEQAVRTTAGRAYRLTFQHSPRPGVSNPSNKFDVYWNNTKLVTVNRSGSGLSVPSWQTATFTVTGTGGNDVISFRENDNNNLGALLDNVQLVAT